MGSLGSLGMASRPTSQGGATDVQLAKFNSLPRLLDDIRLITEDRSTATAAQLHIFRYRNAQFWGRNLCAEAGHPPAGEQSRDRHQAHDLGAARCSSRPASHSRRSRPWRTPPGRARQGPKDGTATWLPQSCRAAISHFPATNDICASDDGPRCHSVVRCCSTDARGRLAHSGGCIPRSPSLRPRWIDAAMRGAAILGRIFLGQPRALATRAGRRAGALLP